MSPFIIFHLPIDPVSLWPPRLEGDPELFRRKRTEKRKRQKQNVRAVGAWKVPWIPFLTSLYCLDWESAWEGPNQEDFLVRLRGKPAPSLFSLTLSSLDGIFSFIGRMT